MIIIIITMITITMIITILVNNHDCNATCLKAMLRSF